MLLRNKQKELNSIYLINFSRIFSSSLTAHYLQIQIHFVKQSPISFHLMHCWLSKTLRFLRTRTTFSETKRTKSSIIERNHKNEEVRSRQSHPEEDSLTWEGGMEGNGRERERKREKGEDVQLNCYDIIRVDLMFDGDVGRRGGEVKEGEPVKVEQLGDRVEPGFGNHSFFGLGRGYHLTSSFRDLRLFSELGPLALFRSPVSFPFSTATLVSSSRSLFRHGVQLRYPTHVTWAQFSAPMTGRADRAMKRFELTRIKLYNLAARLLGTRIERVSFVNSKRSYFISFFEVDPFDPRRDTHSSHLCPLLSLDKLTFLTVVLIFCTRRCFN